MRQEAECHTAHPGEASAQVRTDAQVTTPLTPPWTRLDKTFIIFLFPEGEEREMRSKWKYTKLSNLPRDATEIMYETCSAG